MVGFIVQYSFYWLYYCWDSCIKYDDAVFIYFWTKGAGAWYSTRYLKVEGIYDK
jgi:hypothetical protein